MAITTTTTSITETRHRDDQYKSNPSIASRKHRQLQHYSKEKKEKNKKTKKFVINVNAQSITAKNHNKKISK